jgi:molybdopterin converting factor small subunit
LTNADYLVWALGSHQVLLGLYVNGEDVRFLQGLDTQLKTGDEVSIVPAVAGGS